MQIVFKDIGLYKNTYGENRNKKEKPGRALKEHNIRCHAEQKEQKSQTTGRVQNERQRCSPIFLS